MLPRADWPPSWILDDEGQLHPSANERAKKERLVRLMPLSWTIACVGGTGKSAAASNVDTSGATAAGTVSVTASSDWHQLGFSWRIQQTFFFFFFKRPYDTRTL